MLPKPTKQPSKSKLKKQCDILASQYYRAETPYCELAGKDTIACGGSLQWMHIFSRANVVLRYEPYNKLVGCAGHHIFYTYNPVEWVRFLERWFPERLAEAEANRNAIRKVDYRAWIEHFTQKSRNE